MFEKYCNDCEYNFVRTCESGYYFHDKPIYSTDTISSITSSMMPSPKLLYSPDNLKLCDYWFIVGQMDDIQDQINESDVFVSTTLLQNKCGQNWETTHSVIPKVIVVPKTELKWYSTKVLISALNDDEYLPVKINED